MKPKQTKNIRGFHLVTHAIDNLENKSPSLLLWYYFICYCCCCIVLLKEKLGIDDQQQSIFCCCCYYYLQSGGKSSSLKNHFCWGRRIPTHPTSTEKERDWVCVDKERRCSVF